MLRLYFLVPDTQRAVQISNELASMGLEQDEVHVLAKDQVALEEQGLNQATLLQTTDVVHATKRGVLLGVPLGVVLGLVAAYFLPIAGGSTGMVALLIGAGLFGGFFGAWASSMVGVSVLDVKVEQFTPEIERGACLMMVDVPEQREQEIAAAVKGHHPEVVIDKITAADKHQAGGQGA